MKRLHAVLLLAVTAMLNACASPTLKLYDGAPRAAGEIAEVRVPEQLEIARINGKTLKNAGGNWSRDDRRLQLAPGRYEILAYYREIWELGNQHDVLRSNPALFVVEAHAGGHYRLDYARPASYSAAQNLALQFSGWVEDASGVRTPSQASGLKFRDGLLAQFSGRDELVTDLDATTLAGAQTIAPQAAVTAAAGTTAAVTNAAPLAAVSVPVAANVTTGPGTAPPGPAPDREWLSLMQGFWQQANSEERRAFLRWLATQPGP